MKHIILFNKEDLFIAQAYGKDDNEIINDSTNGVSDEDIASFISRNAGCSIEKAMAIVQEVKALNSDVVKKTISDNLNLISRVSSINLLKSTKYIRMETSTSTKSLLRPMLWSN